MMQTRNANYPYTRKTNKNAVKEESKLLRRSPRNNPDLLKEKVEQQISYKEPDISTLPSIVFKGIINYVNDFYGCAIVSDGIIHEVESSKDDIVPIGFDLEWPFSFQTGSGKTALAQICLSDKVCHLLYLYDLQKLPAALIVLLKHPKVRLVGVNIKNDVWKLGRDFKEFPAKQVVENNCIDCGPFANSILKRSCRWSLQKLTAYLLQKKISKDPSVRMSKWHIQPLSKEQKAYAATDAYVSLLLHQTIQKKADELALKLEKENYEI
ncbi:Werner Syndrome-like exonuclease [Cephus cinctus]|uniref:3'-5' exonuclease n=1 Tax=Cephus cinctus TaxID=211228 RepID=A0AAJ7FKE1_CEPCN|nr:Werner Syndrome-like exonuclease [Cephus cinctus]